MSSSVVSLSAKGIRQLEDTNRVGVDSRKKLQSGLSTKDSLSMKGATEHSMTVQIKHYTLWKKNGGRWPSGLKTEYKNIVKEGAANGIYYVSVDALIKGRVEQDQDGKDIYFSEQGRDMSDVEYLKNLSENKECLEFLASKNKTGTRCAHDKMKETYGLSNNNLSIKGLEHARSDRRMSDEGKLVSCPSDYRHQASSTGLPSSEFVFSFVSQDPRVVETIVVYQPQDTVAVDAQNSGRRGRGPRRSLSADGNSSGGGFSFGKDRRRSRSFEPDTRSAGQGYDHRGGYQGSRGHYGGHTDDDLSSLGAGGAESQAGVTFADFGGRYNGFGERVGAESGGQFNGFGDGGGGRPNPGLAAEYAGDDAARQTQSTNRWNQIGMMTSLFNRALDEDAEDNIVRARQVANLWGQPILATPLNQRQQRAPMHPELVGPMNRNLAGAFNQAHGSQAGAHGRMRGQENQRGNQMHQEEEMDQKPRARSTNRRRR